MKKNRILTDSLALAIVKVMTMVVSIISTMILSRMLDLTSYGTYSTGNLIINTATSISALGLLDAVNYYYNSKKDLKESYINTIFALVIFNGIVVAILILAFGNYIKKYFHNDLLSYIYIYIIFRPLLGNLGLGLQNLQVSIGKAKIVAIRNGIISIAKLVSVVITAFMTKNIVTIFAIMLFIEFTSLFFYCKVLKENNVIIKPYKLNVNLLKEIIVYCVPMGIYIQTNALSRDLDKYVIGFFESTDKLAIYTNAATKLPFDVVSGPLLTVLIPILTRCIANKDFKNGTKLFKSNIKIGYTVTFILGTTILALAEPSILFLYGEKYLAGKSVFMFYVLVDMMNFISFSIVLGAKGKTKILMVISSVGLVINFVVNYIFYYIFGFIGPAIATLVMTFFLNATLLYMSSKVLKQSMRNLFDWKHLRNLTLQMIILGVVVNRISAFLKYQGLNYFLNLCILGIISLIIGVLLNLKHIKSALNELEIISKVN
ncbi:MAG: lipopolysaccharide biosynthesis protein [Blautia sp.]|uniref:lipopolysaccharide biosynthesis protein n=1 Tax=Blautia sp. TaxID=1955243 RepID=UPI00399497EE